MRKWSLMMAAFTAALLGLTFVASAVSTLDGESYDIEGRYKLRVKAQSVGAKITEDFSTDLNFGSIDGFVVPEGFEFEGLGFDDDGAGLGDDGDLEGDVDDDSRKPARLHELFYDGDSEDDLDFLFSLLAELALEDRLNVACFADLVIVDIVSVVKNSKDFGKIKGKEEFLMTGDVECVGINEVAAALVKSKYRGLSN